MTDINWDEMPEWADVWIEDAQCPENSGWHKEDEFCFKDQNGDTYEKSYMDNNEKVHYPPTKQWRGPEDGFPPAGTVCEFSSKGHHDGFMWCIFRGHMSDGGFIIEYHHATSPERVTCSCFDPDLTKFRPTKSDREEWIDQAMKYVSIYPKEFLSSLYDALKSGELPMPITQEQNK